MSSLMFQPGVSCRVCNCCAKPTICGQANLGSSAGFALAVPSQPSVAKPTWGLLPGLHLLCQANHLWPSQPGVFCRVCNCCAKPTICGQANLGSSAGFGIAVSSHHLWPSQPGVFCRFALAVPSQPSVAKPTWVFCRFAIAVPSQPSVAKHLGSSAGLQLLCQANPSVAKPTWGLLPGLHLLCQANHLWQSQPGVSCRVWNCCAKPTICGQANLGSSAGFAIAVPSQPSVAKPTWGLLLGSHLLCQANHLWPSQPGVFCRRQSQ
eukprot:gene11680-34402_t